MFDPDDISIDSYQVGSGSGFFLTARSEPGFGAGFLLKVGSESMSISPRSASLLETQKMRFKKIRHKNRI